MSASFDDLNAEKTESGCIAWLRLVEDNGGKSVRGALFQTSVQGEPRDFCFGCMERREPTRPRGTVGSTVLPSLTRMLLGAAASTPTLIIALADEAPEGVLTHVTLPDLPLCRIDTTVGHVSGEDKPDHPVGSRAGLLRDSELTDADSSAYRLLCEVMAQARPVEPFDRAAEALEEAFADERVQAATALPGLATVIRLSPLRDYPGHSDNRIEPSHQRAQGAAKTSVQEPDAPSRGDLALAQRLWAVLAAPRKPDLAIQLEWTGPLMPFQQEGVRALLDNSQLLLADDMGLGKTLQAIAALRILRARREARSCLVAAPAALLDQWRREIEKWAPELSAIIIRGSTSDRSWQWAAERDVTLVSYDTLRSDFSGNPQSLVRRRTWDVVVADEAQRIKNRNDTSDALKGLQRTRSWALTGTPIENHEEELASILEFVDHDGSNPSKRYRPGAELRMRHRELQLRRKKGDVLDDLPPKQVTTVTINLNPRQRDSYDKAEREGIVYLKSLGAEVGVRHVLELITRLKQICNADPKTGESSKLDDIKDRLELLAAQGHKALLFSQYVNDTSGVAAAAGYLKDFAPLTITGDMPQQQRTETIERFKARDEHKVLILSLRAGGLGLNLQEASYVFHLDRWWNPAVETQAEDRSHRFGQTVKVNAIKYSCTGTIEERIDEILQRKQALFDELVDDVSLHLSVRMSRDELFSLFGLGRTPASDAGLR